MRGLRERADAAGGNGGRRATRNGDGPDRELVEQVRRGVARRRRGEAEGEPTLARQFARVGVLGWMIVVPTLLGVLAGRWIDHRFGTGIFWSAPLLFVGLAVGAWSAWRWMHRP